MDTEEIADVNFFGFFNNMKKLPKRRKNHIYHNWDAAGGLIRVTQYEFLNEFASLEADSMRWQW